METRRLLDLLRLVWVGKLITPKVEFDRLYIFKESEVLDFLSLDEVGLVLGQAEHTLLVLSPRGAVGHASPLYLDEAHR